MKVAAAHAIAGYIAKPTRDRILPNILDKEVTKEVARAVKDAAVLCGCSRPI
jgi:malic enzyme